MSIRPNRKFDSVHRCTFPTFNHGPGTAQKREKVSVNTQSGTRHFRYFRQALMAAAVPLERSMHNESKLARYILVFRPSASQFKVFKLNVCPGFNENLILICKDNALRHLYIQYNRPI